MERAGLTHMCGGQKLRMDTSRARSPSPTADLPAQGSSAREITPHNIWLQKPVVIELVEEISGAPSSSF